MIVLAAVLLATLSLAGCAAGGSSGSVAGPDAAAPAVPKPDAGGSASTGTVAKDGTQRAVVITGEAVIAAKDPVAAASSATRIVTAAGGRVDGRTEQAGADGAAGTATLTLRIPASRLDTTLTALERLGRTDRVTTSTSDVTGQTQDLDARITALRTTIQRMLELEQRATDTSDLIQLETAIGDRQGQLESLEAQQRDLADQVAMATITLRLVPSGAAVRTTTAGFGDGLATGWSSFVAFWGGFLVVMGVMLPWIVTMALLAAIALGVLALVRRRQSAEARMRSRTASP